MAEDNKLEDLILEEPESSSNKKGILVILGLVVLLLIIGVVLVNIIFGSGSDANKTKESVKDEIIQERNQKIANLNIKKDDNLNIDDDLAPIDEKDNIDETMKDNSTKDDIITGASVVTAGAANMAAKKAVERTKKDNMRDEILEEEPKKVEKVRRVVKKEHRIKPKTKPRIREVQRAKKYINYGGNVYIQVGSFSRGPNSEFINKIRRAGFKYRIQEVNGFRRVLIGPFRSTNEAKRYLGTVRARISSSAFIKR